MSWAVHFGQRNGRLKAPMETGDELPGLTGPFGSAIIVKFRCHSINGFPVRLDGAVGSSSGAKCR